MRAVLFALAAAACAHVSPSVAAGRHTMIVPVSATVTLHARVVGDGPETWILVHGGPGLSSEYLDGLERLAAPGRRLVFYDQRGVGESTVGESDGHGFVEHVGDLEALRAALAADKIVLVGHSWGGLVAMAYAGAHPEHLSALVLLDSGPPTAAGLEQAGDAFDARVKELIARKIIPDPQPKAVGKSCDATITSLLPAYFADPARGQGMAFAPGVCRAGIAPVTFAAIGDYDLRPGLARLPIPVLVVGGAGDAFGQPMYDAVVAAFPKERVRAALIPDAGHFPWLEQPAAFDAVLAGFHP